MVPAPIVLFVYNRPHHTKRTIEALQKNELSSKSKLFIYSDAPKNDKAKATVDEVREFISSIDGFKKVTIFEREKNWGLAASIIDGVTKIVNEYGKVIVLEDDIVTSSYFLKFMNEALDFYQDEKKVWHVSGWSYPIDTQGLEDVFFWRVMNCWGWATWKDRWRYFEKDVDQVMQEFSKIDIKRFNLDGAENFWKQVILNKKNKINTWEIFWYATIFKQNGLCLNPSQTFVRNIGLDGSGIHCTGVDIYQQHTLFPKNHVSFQIHLKEDMTALKRIQNFYKFQKRKYLFARILNKARSLIVKNWIWRKYYDTKNHTSNLERQ